MPLTYDVLFLFADVCSVLEEMEAQGATKKTDDEELVGELARAGAEYAKWAHIPWPEQAGPPTNWPLAPELWQPKEHRHNLKLALAYIFRELASMDRGKTPALHVETASSETQDSLF